VILLGKWFVAIKLAHRIELHDESMLRNHKGIIRGPFMKTLLNMVVLALLACAGSVHAGPIAVAGREWLQPVDFVNFSWNTINETCDAANGGACAGSLGGST
jgi:hypothetical protein